MLKKKALIQAEKDTKNEVQKNVRLFLTFGHI